MSLAQFGDPAVKSFLTTLDASQLSAALAPFHVPTIVSAGPGSGKTRTLIGRVAALVASGVAPHHVLVISFTRQACAELRARLLTLLGQRGGRVKVWTFHATALRLARQLPDAAAAALLEGAPDDLAPPSTDGLLTRTFRVTTNAKELRALFQHAMFEEMGARLSAAQKRAADGAADDLNAMRFVLPVSRSDFDAMRGGEEPPRSFDYKTEVGVFRLTPSGVQQVAAAPPGATAVGTVGEPFLARRLLDRFSKEESNFFSAWRILRTSGFGLEDIAALVARAEGDAPPPSSPPLSSLRNLLRISTRFVASQVKRNTVTMADAVPLATRLLCRERAAQAWASQEARALLVDEFQDTSPAQFNIMLELAKYLGATPGASDVDGPCGPALTVVGDDKQSIFGFQGSLPSAFEHLGASLGEARVSRHVLNRNYRSQACIVSFSNAVIPGSPASISQMPAAAPVSIVKCRDLTREAEFILHEVVRLVKTGATRYADIAILTRTKRVLFELAQVFNAVGLPYARVGGSSFSLRSVRNLSIVLRACVSGDQLGEDNDTVLEFVEIAIPKLSRDTVEAVRALSRGGGGSGAGWLSKGGAKEGDAAGQRPSAYAALNALLSEIEAAHRDLAAANDLLKSADTRLRAAVKSEATAATRADKAGAKRARDEDLHVTALATLASVRAEHAAAAAGAAKTRLAARLPIKDASKVKEFLSRLGFERKAAGSRPLAATVDALMQAFPEAFIDASVIRKSYDPFLERDIAFEEGVAAFTPTPSKDQVGGAAGAHKNRVDARSKIEVGGVRGVKLPPGGVPSVVTPATTTLRAMMQAEALLFESQLLSTWKQNDSARGRGGGASAVAGVYDADDDEGGGGGGGGGGADDFSELEQNERARLKGADPRILALRCFSAHLAEIVAVSEDVSGVSTAPGNAAAAAALAFVTARSTRDRDSLAAAAIAAREMSNAITLGTIHSAKGREWPVVFVPRAHVNEMPLPFEEADDGADDDELALHLPTPAGLVAAALGGEDALRSISFSEERRLFFVAASRAKDKLVVTYPESDGSVIGVPESFVRTSFLKSLETDFDAACWREIEYGK
jgi:superfamily I DNA/RNA helicase